ncbi:alpha/beta fold hydrolase [Polaromonas jejuensis]|uniref:Alpha/beta fold hydrolase n=1 Tax=Polaromonas jejuensis TaxID=457502 RepID=A0ABW0Q6M4_9BURK|nr:alpha/beta hydrolase [Polaromonas jejuensis]
MSWILLRGLTREARHWGSLPQRLAPLVQTTGAGITPVLALDLPGNGAFYRETSPPSAREMVDFARRQLRAQGLAPPYSLLAMSLGGMVAADWAQQHPQEIAGLVLINTSMRPFSHVSERLRPGRWPALAWLAARWRAAVPAERLIHRLTCRQMATREQDIAAWVGIRQDAPVSAANALRQLWAAARFSSTAPPRCPTLLLSSQGDQLVDPRCSARLARAWQATHHQHPWAGHDLPHDDADWVCQRISDWLAGA